MTGRAVEFDMCCIYNIAKQNKHANGHYKTNKQKKAGGRGRSKQRAQDAPPRYFFENGTRVQHMGADCEPGRGLGGRAANRTGLDSGKNSCEPNRTGLRTVANRTGLDWGNLRTEPDPSPLRSLSNCALQLPYGDFRSCRWTGMMLRKPPMISKSRLFPIG